MSDRKLTPELLLGAYAAGVFPMAEARDDPEVFWVDPRRRGVLPLDGFRMSRSLARRLRRGDVEAGLDDDFAGVLDGWNGTGDSVRDVPGGWEHSGELPLGVWTAGRLLAQRMEPMMRLLPRVEDPGTALHRTPW